MTIGFDEVFISGLDLETSRGTAKERLYIPIKPRDIEETDDIYRNLKGYNVLLQLTSLWYIRLEHLSLNLFKKTIKITNDILNLNVVKEEDFVCLAYDRSKAVRKSNLKGFSRFFEDFRHFRKGHL